MQVGKTKIAILDQNLTSSRVVNGVTASVIHTSASPDRGKLVSNKRRRLLFAADGR